MSTLRFNTWQNTGGTEVANSTLGTGKILQVVSITKTDTFSTTTISGAEITGLSATITPTSTSSKILSVCNVDIGSSADVFIVLSLLRGGSAISVADTAGSRRISTVGRYLGTATTAGVTHASQTFSYLDSPSTLSSTTYSVEIGANSAATLYVNRGHDDTDAASRFRATSTITLMEVSA